jgi:GrpB-like predicted nucleotidyltransferase (UPF0157 family)
VRTHPLWRPFEIPTDEEIVAARVNAPQRTSPVEVVAPDPGWPQVYDGLAARIRAALGERVLELAHVGSTAVAGLAAKPVIDIDLTVADSADEASYVPAMEADGWVLRLREPGWEEHRLLRLEDPECNLHVWSPGSAEPQRHRMFRDWLRNHDDDRERYAATKRDIADLGFTDAMHYKQRQGRHGLRPLRAGLRGRPRSPPRPTSARLRGSLVPTAQLRGCGGGGGRSQAGTPTSWADRSQSPSMIAWSWACLFSRPSAEKRL